MMPGVSVGSNEMMSPPVGDAAAIASRNEQDNDVQPLVLWMSIVVFTTKSVACANADKTMSKKNVTKRRIFMTIPPFQTGREAIAETVRPKRDVRILVVGCPLEKRSIKPDLACVGLNPLCRGFFCR